MNGLELVQPEYADEQDKNTLVPYVATSGGDRGYKDNNNAVEVTLHHGTR